MKLAVALAVLYGQCGHVLDLLRASGPQAKPGCEQALGGGRVMAYNEDFRL